MNFPFTSLIRHELIRKLRAVRPFLLVIAAVSVPSFMVMTWWPESAPDYFRMGRETSLVILISSLVTWCFAAMLVLPVYGAVSIILERQQETFDQVFLTLITPTGIIVGKVLNTLGMYLVIMIAMAPLVATMYFLVGIDVSSFLVSVAILLSVAYSITCISVLCSILSRNVLRALIRSFFFSGAAVGGAFIVGMYVYVIASEILLLPLGSLRNPMPYIYTFIPFATAVGYAVEPQTIPPSTWLWTIGLQLGIGTACLLSAIKVVRHLALLPLQKVRISLWRRVLGTRSGKSKPVRPLSDHVNPIYAREIIWEGFARVGQRRRTLVLGLMLGGGILVTLYIARKEIGEVLAIMWSGMLMVSVAVSAPMSTANSVTREEELGNLDMLRMTLLRPREVILGKTLAGLRGLSPLFIASLLLFPFVLYGDRREFDQALLTCLVSFGSACVFALVGTTLGITVSAFSKRTPVAVVITYLANVSVYFGIYLSALLATEILVAFWEYGIGHQQELHTQLISFCDFLKLFSPLLGYMENLERNYHRGDLISGYWLSNVALCTGYSVMLLWLAIAGFRLKWEKRRQ